MASEIPAYNPALPTYNTAQEAANAVPAINTGAVAPATPANILNSNIDKNIFIHQIRDQHYYIEIFLYNQIDGYEPVPIQFFFIDSFSLNETLMNWITTGWIILKNNFEILERGGLTTEHYSDISQSNTGEKIKASYVFRTDGRNKISFRLYPISDKNESFPRDSWEICYDFIIHDVEDLPTGNNQEKLRKYYFHDERFQIFSERNMEFSTTYTYAKKVKNPNVLKQNLSDDKRAFNPNVVLQEIIKTVGCEPPTNKDINAVSTLKVGFKENGSLADPTEPIDKIDDKNWDLGVTNDPNNKIFYTSPANHTAVDDINYVLEYCVSRDGGPVFLDIGRTSNDKTWKLLSLSDLFKNSEKNQVEQLIIEDAVSGYGNKPQMSRASTDVDENNTKNFTSGIASRILTYSFSPMVASDDSRITNAPVHNYDFSTGTFNINFANNKAVDVKTQMEFYMDSGKNGLYSFRHGKGAHALLNLNKTKTSGIALTNNFLPQKFYPKNYSQVKMIKDALFLNEAICFQVQGLTIRTPGKFIHINRIASNGERNPFDDRFLGQWLIIKVNHVFTQKTYLTEIVAVKVDTFAKLWDATEQIY